MSLSFLLSFHSLCPPLHLFLQSEICSGGMKKKLSLICRPVYLQGESQHNNEERVQLLGLSIVCSLAPSLFSFSKTPRSLPSPLKRCRVILLISVQRPVDSHGTSTACPLLSSILLTLLHSRDRIHFY